MAFDGSGPNRRLSINSKTLSQVEIVEKYLETRSRKEKKIILNYLELNKLKGGVKV